MSGCSNATEQTDSTAPSIKPPTTPLANTVAPAATSTSKATQSKQNLSTTTSSNTVATKHSKTEHSNDLGDYGDYPKLTNLIDELVTEQQFSRDDLIALFAQVKRRDDILEAMSKPAERTKTWAEYKPLFVNELGTSNGIKFWQKHADDLTRAAKQFNIPEALIVAIIGVETRYGTFKGKHRVIEALATLAFDHPPRAEFFYQQLKQFMVLARDLNWNPMEPLGSYAGAMGYAQFIPSSYINLAIDFDGDNKPDLIDSPVDAIGSIANYFRHHNWQPGQPTLELAELSSKAIPEQLAPLLDKPLKPTTPIATVEQAGLNANPKRDDKTLVRPFTFINGQTTEYWYGHHNFFVITEYNHSKLYARAVLELAQAIEQRYSGEITLSIMEEGKSAAQ